MYGLLLSYMRGLFVYCPILLVRFKRNGLFLFGLLESDVDRDRAVRHDELCLTGHVVDDFDIVAEGIGDFDALERSALVRGIEDTDVVAFVCRADVGIRVGRAAFADFIGLESCCTVGSPFSALMI